MPCKGNCFFSFNQNMVKNLHDSIFCIIFAELLKFNLIFNNNTFLTYEPKKSLPLR
jgi:hypothetical protein